MIHIIKISEIINSNNATSREDGNKVFEETMKFIGKDLDVELNFEGISALISRFLHASIGKIYRQLGENYSNRIIVTNLSRPSWEVLYEDVIELASNPSIGQARASALSAAFEA
jgi:STAS-like domain of unknown function (DUF4325)